MGQGKASLMGKIVEGANEAQGFLGSCTDTLTHTARRHISARVGPGKDIVLQKYKTLIF